MSELLRVDRETPEAAAELVHRLTTNQPEPGVRVVAEGREVVIHTDNALVDLFARTVSGVATVCGRIGKALPARNRDAPVEAGAIAKGDDHYTPEIDKAA